MLYRQLLTKEQAFQKAKHYCAYQERCHTEVKEKLYSFGLRKTDVETTLSELIEQDYLNEERFAIQFVRGKFRMKQWGRVKIQYELRQKRVSEYCIRTALKQLDEADYLKTVRKLAAAKWKTQKSEKNLFVKLSKTRDFLMQKGFEPELIKTALQELQE
jgi:regulatory protein